MTLFVDIDERLFTFIDSFGTTQEASDSAFNNWITFASHNKDIKALHAERPFINVLVKHPVQVDTYNCGVFVCKFISMLVQGEVINETSFDPTALNAFRATILSHTTM